MQLMLVCLFVHPNESIIMDLAVSSDLAIYRNVRSSGVLQSCNYFIEKQCWRFISMRIGRYYVANLA